jgi:hypothetical protein
MFKKQPFFKRAASEEAKIVASSLESNLDLALFNIISILTFYGLCFISRSFFAQFFYNRDFSALFKFCKKLNLCKCQFSLISL